MTTEHRAAAPALLLGIDGGGTRTTAWMADAQGHILGQAAAGPSNPTKAGLLRAQRNLASAVQDAFRQARQQNRTIAAVCAGIAGTDRSALRRHMEAALRRTVRAKHYLVTTDAAIALESALGRKPGVVVISGTGSIGYGRDRQGNTERSGGWGSTFDDAGSGYELGRKAVIAALKDFDGRGPRTRLRLDLCRVLKVRSVTQIISKPLAPHELAALFPCVVEAAQSGDAVAKKLCRDAGADLAELAWALLKRLRLLRGVYPVVCAGGVFNSSRHVRESFRRNLHAVAPHAEVSLLRRQPVEGALDLARRMIEEKGRGELRSAG